MQENMCDCAIALGNNCHSGVSITYLKKSELYHLKKHIVLKLRKITDSKNIASRTRIGISKALKENDSRQILEYHGYSTFNYCSVCGKKIKWEDID